MNAWIGWALAVALVGVGYARFGWQGALAGVTLAVFWVLMQFSRTLRVMRQAGHAPMGHVDSAVMLHSKLKAGMRLLDILPLTRSLGERLDADDRNAEHWRWTDTGGISVTVLLRAGRLVEWQLSRPEGSPENGDGTEVAAL